MNVRKMKKRLKKQIDKLQSDNDLMHDIISNNPSMQETYDRWTQPINVAYTSMRFEKFKARMNFSGEVDLDNITKYVNVKQLLANDLFEKIKDSITYEVDMEQEFPTVTASIIVAYNDQKEDV